MKTSLKIVLGLGLGFVGFGWGNVSFATEPTSAEKSGETYPTCGSKSDNAYKILPEEGAATPTKPHEKGKSTSGSAATEH